MRWRLATRECLDLRLLELMPPLAALCPPATVIDKVASSPTILITFSARRPGGRAFQNTGPVSSHRLQPRMCAGLCSRVMMSAMASPTPGDFAQAPLADDLSERHS